jgi:hypothetical protein
VTQEEILGKLVYQDFSYKSFFKADDKMDILNGKLDIFNGKICQSGYPSEEDDDGHIVSDEEL